MAAVLGGALRAMTPLAVAFHIGGVTLSEFYFSIDMFLLLGLCGVYLGAEKPLGLAGGAGFATFIIGILLVRTGVVSYPLAAATALLGTTILAVAMLWHGASRAAPVLWLAAQGAGLASLAAPAAFFALSGILFGLGFVTAGFEQMRRLRPSEAMRGAGKEFREPAP
jgi:hypothetical protein